MKKVSLSPFVRVIAAGLIIFCFAAIIIFAAAERPHDSDHEEKPKNIADIAQKLEDAGYAVTYYEGGSAMLEALDDEMDQYLDNPTEQPLSGYLFANDGVTGDLACEVFLFQNARDASALYNYLKGGEQFIEGKSEIRQSTTVVYMGYIEVLEEIEKQIL